MDGNFLGPSETYFKPDQFHERSFGNRAHEIYDLLNHKIQNENFPCVGAKAAINGAEYRLGVYNYMGTPETTAQLAHDLKLYKNEVEQNDSMYMSFIATFKDEIHSERTFEALLWRQLQQLYNLSKIKTPLDPQVSNDPTDDNFSFIFEGIAYFVVGMHYHASRLARKFPYPALAFNLHSQFKALREGGMFEKMKSIIRERETALQGDFNPMLKDFGKGSEAPQYAGRKVDGSWKCPFHV